MNIPRDFVLGAATSSYQIEGAARVDGRGLSIWDTFCSTPGNVRDGDTGDIACDHYRRFETDVALMREIGLESYRFSIAWPRLFPDGRGTLNEIGLDFYKRLVDALLSADIQPMATLYHWDLPQALADEGGWLNRGTAAAFADYAEIVFRRLGDVIPRFITLNEPWCSAALGYGLGDHAPGMKNYGAAAVAMHNLLLAHGQAVERFRRLGLKGTEIGITNILTDVRPASDSDADRTAAERMDALMNRWTMEPLFHGRYPDEIRALGIDHVVRDGDLALIAQPLDFLGVNYYQPTVVAANPDDPLLGVRILPVEGDCTAMGWAIAPDGLERILQRIPKAYTAIPIYITESGAAFTDVPDSTGQVHDVARIDYLHRHLAAAINARLAGVDVRGYYVWSLLDNFEWQQGYSCRFGLIYVDYATQARTLKDSAKWYRDVIRNRTL